MDKDLKHMPLVEAILEVRWKLQGVPPAPPVDPHYKLLLGRLFDRFLKEYPEHEQLSAANIPDELAGYVIQHRFRVAKDSWPLIQVGPGIFAVNSTTDYRWSEFHSRTIAAIDKLYDAHPSKVDFRVTHLILRYINAVNFDFRNNDAFQFLQNKLKVQVSLLEGLFEATSVERRPYAFSSQFSFKCGSPRGLLSVRFATGQNKNTPAIVWETMVESVGEDLPDMPTEFDGWVKAAHGVTDDWFKKTIQGELLREFSGE